MVHQLLVTDHYLEVTTWKKKQLYMLLTNKSILLNHSGFHFDERYRSRRANPS